MSDVQGHLERRAAQRFGFHLPLSVRSVSPEGRGQGVTQNLSARGAFFCTDFSLTEGDAIELTLVMPSEITLAENMRVRCRGKVMRVVPPLSGTRFEVARSEEHTSELQSRGHLVCRLLLEKKKNE